MKHQIAIVQAALLVMSAFTTNAHAQDVACEPITIFAAASTTDVMEKIADDYERNTACSVTTVFAASGTLARQIASGAPADLFLSANVEWMDWLEHSAILKPENRTNLLGNDLVLIVPTSTDATSADLNTPEGILAFLGDERLAIGDPASVPAGRYADAYIRRMGLSQNLKDNIVTAASVRAALTWVARNEAAAGIVYRTDAMIEDSVSIAATFPATPGAPIVYPLALMGRHPHADARAFYDHLQTYDAAVAFADGGFRRVSAE